MVKGKRERERAEAWEMRKRGVRDGEEREIERERAEEWEKRGMRDGEERESWGVRKF